jgi:hypothetical protein
MERFEEPLAKKLIRMLDSSTTAKKIRIEATIPNIFLDIILISFSQVLRILKILTDQILKKLKKLRKNGNKSGYNILS